MKKTGRTQKKKRKEKLKGQLHASPPWLSIFYYMFSTLYMCSLSSKAGKTIPVCVVILTNTSFSVSMNILML